MVSDKSQAWATGPVEILTRQPVKGRKRGGGIRFGEMERDSLLSHGAAFNLNDWLFKSAGEDESEGFICDKCGSVLTSYPKKGLQFMTEQPDSSEVESKVRCKVCETSDCTRVWMPFVLRYLTNELAAMGIQVKYHTK